MKALNFQGNQYKMIFEKNFGKFCDAIYSSNDVKTILEDVHNHAAVKVPTDTCPYPKGPNEIKSYLLKGFEKLLPPYMPGGEKWQFQLRFIKDGEIMGGYNFYVLIRTQESLINGR